MLLRTPEHLVSGGKEVVGMKTNVIIGVFVVIIAGVLFWGAPKRAIGVSPAQLTIQINQQQPATFQVKLLYKPWFEKTFKPISGDITFSHSSRVQLTPESETTSPGTNRTATIQVVGTVVGDATITVKGESRKGEHDENEVAVTVIQAE